ncbi:MAG: hypothetical protein HC936_19185 [Leptolyngbyaceae cyanobacterium SU_3_3]|nr:hypothetical protein [Leptolyngbyaceae cyanobacterium SU_3_3]
MPLVEPYTIAYAIGGANMSIPAGFGLPPSAGSVGIHDPFLELGGHSLLATQVMARVNEVFEVQLPLHTLFSTPTVAKFAEAIEQYQMSTQPQMPALVSVVREARRMTLSSIQAKLAGKSKKEFAEKTSAMVFTLPEESDRSRKEHAADIATLPEKNTQTYNTLPIHKSVKTAEEL